MAAENECHPPTPPFPQSHSISAIKSYSHLALNYTDKWNSVRVFVWFVYHLPQTALPIEIRELAYPHRILGFWITTHKINAPSPRDHRIPLWWNRDHSLPEAGPSNYTLENSKVHKTNSYSIRLGFCGQII